MHLYELSDQYNEIWSLLDNEEIDEQAILDTLESVQEEVKDKAVSIACIIKEIKANISAFKAEEEKLKQRRQVLENEVSRISNYLTEQMQRADLAKIQDPKAQISFRNSKSTSITDPIALVEWAKANNADLLTFSEPTISKTAVKNAIESGEKIPYAEIVTNQSLIIK